ncbi:MAG: trypsin-like peptidase domain-containing protein, partial [Planctomycetaceae bacterium]|nr:trypsin-like peptidase domain-containing protein [Planctomycetaceae bacterium]
MPGIPGGNGWQSQICRADLPEALQKQQADRIATIGRVSPAVVAIFPPSGKGGGSGVIVSPNGLALTNFHVVDGAGPFLKCGLNDGVIYDAVLIGIDPTGDVAMIQLLGREDFPHAPLGDSDQVRVGDWAFAMGNPFLLADDFAPTLTYGMVSGVQRYQYPAGTYLEYTDCIQVDTSINPGNSGGPLFNEAGEVIGINGRISVEKRGRVNVGAGYAISINQIKKFSDHLLSGRVVDHATLGATVVSDEFSNVIVDEVRPHSSADFYGLKPGDELISFGGRAIGSVNQFKNVLGIYPKGWKVPLVYRRDGERFEIFPRLEGLHSTAELMEFAKVEEQEGHPEGMPIPLPHMEKKPEIPEKYADLYEARLGYANYRFNRIKQEELLGRLREYGKYGSQEDKWSFQGTIAEGGVFRLVLAEFACLMELPTTGRVHLLDLGRPESLLEGPYEAGTLMALYEWFELFVHGADVVYEVYYVGSE